LSKSARLEVENARLDFRAQKSRKPRGGMAQAVPPFLFAALKRRVKRLLPINDILYFISGIGSIKRDPFRGRVCFM
jgi:hypothetical protein